MAEKITRGVKNALRLEARLMDDQQLVTAAQMSLALWSLTRDNSMDRWIIYNEEWFRRKGHYHVK